MMLQASMLQTTKLNGNSTSKRNCGSRRRSCVWLRCIITYGPLPLWLSKARFSVALNPHRADTAPDYLRAKSLTDESVDLSRKILDSRLKLTRLRQAYPQPRLTVPSAEAQLDAQVLEMQSLEDKLQGLNEDIESVKEKVKSGAREIERLRVEKGEVDKLVKQSKSEEEDARVIQLYDW